MNDLTISLNHGERLSRVPLVVDVLDDDLNTVWSGPIQLGDSRAVVLPRPGKYAVQVKLPSGQTMTRLCDVQEGAPASVELAPAAGSPHESLEWATLSKPEALRGGDEDQLQSVWLRLWSRSSTADWSVVPWTPISVDRDPGVAQYTFGFRSMQQFGQYFLQVGGPSMAWKLVALPADDIHVLITGVAEGDGKRDPVDMTVTSVEHRGEALLGYMAQGEMEEARSVAKALLHDKVENPTAAAAAAYFLLRTGDFEEFRRWMANLANLMQWLPDGSVIDAWAILRSARPDPVRARDRLVEAADRGLPVYTAGLRLLIDGLSLFAADKMLKTPEIIAALEDVRRYGAAAEWRARTTTFVGSDPESPGEDIRGHPEDRKHVEFLGGPPATSASAASASMESREARPQRRARDRAGEAAEASREVTREDARQRRHAILQNPSVFQFSDFAPAAGADTPITIEPSSELAAMVGAGVRSAEAVTRRLLGYAYRQGGASAERSSRIPPALGKLLGGIDLRGTTYDALKQRVLTSLAQGGSGEAAMESATGGGTTEARAGGARATRSGTSGSSRPVARRRPSRSTGREARGASAEGASQD